MERRSFLATLLAAPVVARLGKVERLPAPVLSNQGSLGPAADLSPPPERRYYMPVYTAGEGLPWKWVEVYT